MDGSKTSAKVKMTRIEFLLLKPSEALRIFTFLPLNLLNVTIEQCLMLLKVFLQVYRAVEVYFIFSLKLSGFIF